MIEANYLLKIFNASPLPSLLLLPDSPRFTIKQANTAFLITTDTKAADLTDKGFFDVFPAKPEVKGGVDENSALFQSFLTVISSGKSDKIFNQRYNKQNAATHTFEPTYLNAENIAICDSNNDVSYILHTTEKINENRYYQQLEHLERDILEMNAKKEKTIREVLTHFMLGIEKLHPGMICSMQEKKGNQLFNLASPNLPQEFLETINGIEIGENIGTCGRAAFLKQKVITSDISNDAHWTRIKPITLKYQLKACFSHPVIDSAGNVIATFATYFGENKTPAILEENTIQRAGHILQIIFERSLKDEAIKANEDKLRNLVWDMQVGVILQGPKAEIIFSNPKALEFLGISEDQLLGKTSFDLDWNVIHEDGTPFTGPDHPVPQAIATRLPIKDIVMGVYRPNIGDRVWLLVDAKPQLHKDGTVHHVVCSFINITERLEAEKKLVEHNAQLNAILESASSSIFSIDREYKYTNFNKAHAAGMKKIYGVDIEIGKCILEYQNPIDREIAKRSLDRALNGEQFPESAYSGNEGLIRPYYEISHNPIFTPSGKVIGVSVFAKDLTGQKQTEDALKASEERYRSIMLASPDQIAITDLEGNVIMASPSSISKLGFKTEAEVLNQPITNFIVPEDRERAASKLALMFQGIMTGPAEYRGSHLDGSIFDIEVNAEFIRDSNNQPIQIVFIIRDISERKLAEKELKRQKDFFEQMFMQSSISTQILDKDGWCERINPKLTELFGVQPAQVEGKLYNIFKDEAIIQTGTMALLKTVFFEGKTAEWEVNFDIGLSAKSQNIEIAEKKTVWFNNRAFPIFDSSEKVTHVIIQHTDITVKKRAEAEMASMAQALDIAPNAITIHDFEGRFLYSNQYNLNLHGYSLQEFMAINLHQIDVPASEQLIYKRTDELKREGKTKFQAEHFKKDGTILPLEIYIQKTNWEGKEVVMSMGTDITERRLAEIALQESEQRYKALVEWSPDAIGVYRNGIILFANPAGVKMFGSNSEDELIGKPIFDLVHPEFHQLSAERTKLIYENNETLPMAEMKFLRVDGTPIDVEVQSTRIVYDGSAAIQVTIRDITQRKQEERHLKLLESVITNSNDAVVITEASPIEEPGPKILYVNEAFIKMTGYAAAEVIGKSPRILQGPKTERAGLDKLKAALKNWEPCEISQINYRKNGEEFWANISISPVADETGSFTHWISIQRDITEQKNAELQKNLFAEISQLFNEPTSLIETLEKMLQRLVAFGNLNLAEAWLIDSNERNINLVATAPLTEKIQFFYEASAHINSFKKGEGLPGIAWESGKIQYWQNIQENRSFSRWEAAKKAGLKNACALPIIYNNAVIGVFVMGCINNEKITDRFYATFEDLGPHIGAEIKRKQLEKELYQIFNFAPDIICISDFDGYFKKINPATCELLEYAEEELKAVPYVEFIHPDDRDKNNKETISLSKGISNYYFENRYITKSGKIKWLAWTASPSPAEGLIFSVAKDITEKKTLQDLLSKVNTLARIGGWEYDLEKSTLYWSSITKEIHELPDEYEPILDTAIDFYKAGESRNMISACVQEGIASGKEWDLELQIITAKGNERWVRSMGEAEFLNGKCKRLYGSLQDVDDRKRAETALQQNIKALEDYKLALDESAIISITDEKGVILEANENFCNISGYAKDELLGKSHRIVNSKFHPKLFFEEMWQTISTGNVWRGEIMNKTKQGNYYWVFATIIPFLGADKKPFQYLAIRFDITEKKKSEENIRISNERYNLVAKATNDAIWDWNLVTHQVVRAGEGLQILFGYDAAEADKDNNFWRRHIHPDDVQRMVNKLTAITGDPTATYWEDEYRFEKSNGQYATVYEKGYIMRDASGKAIRLIGASQDITKLKENEIRLNQLNEDLLLKAKELANSNAELEQFAYVASHDLQEPLRMVTGFLTQIEKKYGSIIDETGKKYIDFAVDGAKRMRQIILDLLEFSRIGRNEGNKELLDLNVLVNEIIILAQKQIDEKRAVIKLQQLPVLPVYKAPLRQVFQNLIGNALKYSRHDIPPRIGIAAKELEDHWQFSVSDNGIGISKEYFEKIFIIFQRLHNKDEFSGTGIGLAVTKKVIDNHGGKIWVESVEGKGSTFYFTIKKHP